MSEHDKKTECVKVWMSERLFVDLNRLAIMDDRKLSDFIGLLLERAAYGLTKPRTGEVPDRGE